MTNTVQARQQSLLATVAAAIEAMRPTQWTKNGLVVLALVFAHRLFDSTAALHVITAFFAFSLAASTIYLINDIGDRERDRYHVRKSRRPIASGRLSIPAAWTTVGITATLTALLTIAVIAFPLPGHDPFADAGGSRLLFMLVIVGYVGMNIAYTRWLKHEVLWDVFIVAAGFVLRAVAGALAIPVPISPWFYLCTLFLALFLALGKRRAEIMLLQQDASQHRANLQAYTLPLLDQLISIVVTGTLITYSLYTFQSDIANHQLMLTIPFVIFGTFRYLYLVYVRHDGGQPDELLWKDRQLLGVVVACVLTILVLIYGPGLFRH